MDQPYHNSHLPQGTKWISIWINISETSIKHLYIEQFGALVATHL